MWPAANVQDTRIAICGEVLGENTPFSQAAVPLSVVKWKGFVAVFNGDGQHLWSHIFFHSTPGECAITDVSIRVEGVGENAVDVVTYCGVSSYGTSGGVGSLGYMDPIHPFTPPAHCGTAAGGDTNNGHGQWDGIVGRLQNSHSNPRNGLGVSNAVHMFHSVVGGGGQDGLFGIHEIDADRFVVVGSTGLPNAPSSAFTFPLPNDCPPLSCPSQSGLDYALGTIQVFNAGCLLGNGLILESGGSIGSDPCVELGRHTVLRDVVAVVDPTNPMLAHLRCVGSSNDPDLGYHGALAGSVDGIVYSGICVLSAPCISGSSNGIGTLAQLSGVYRGGADFDYLTGVQSWSEFPDHFVVAGVTGSGSSADIDWASYYYNLSHSGLPNQAVLLCEAQVGGSDIDAAAVVGVASLTTSGQISFHDYGVGPPDGGGVSVDSSGRTNCVGATVSLDFPNDPPPPISRDKDSLRDAVRVVADLVQVGVGRTDG